MRTAMLELERVAPHLVNDILAEIGEKNTVRVMVTRGGKQELVRTTGLIHQRPL